MMTASLLPSRVRDRLTRDQLAGGALALLVQTGFLLLVLLSPSRSLRPVRETHETLLFFPPLAAPSTIDARNPRRKRIAPSVPFSVPSFTAPPVAASPLASPSGLAGFGQTLFGCAPEHYADLLPEQRARCLKPGEGLANNEQPPLAGVRSHVKDNARWANAMAHKQTIPMLPGGMLFPLAALQAVLDGSISEPSSAFRDPEKWPAERDPAQFMPGKLDQPEQADDTAQKAQPAAPPKK